MATILSLSVSFCKILTITPILQRENMESQRGGRAWLRVTLLEVAVEEFECKSI